MVNLLSEFDLGELIHQSSKTRVHRAVRKDDEARCVVKLQHSEHPALRDLALCQHEYEVTSGLTSPGVLRPLGLFRHKGRIGLVFADFGGVALKEIMALRRLLLEETLAIGIAVARTLAQIHAARVVHKDINPANIVVNLLTGEVKIIDFVLSVVLPRVGVSAHAPSLLEGTLSYISPEQTGRVNRAIDGRSDLYSLGATLYEMATGVVPFSSDDPLELIHSHIALEPVPPHQSDPAVPEALEAVVLKLLAKAAEDRYQTALGVVADLEEIRDALARSGSAPGFVAGRHDVSDRFQIPQKLYGREVESKLLLATLARVAAGRAEVMLVAGHPGIGKTALVNEIHRPLAQAQGYFISGKFDQRRRDIPYAPLLDAFQDLVRQMLAQTGAQLAAWRHKLEAALGHNAGIVTEVIPSLELILGEQPPPQLTTMGAQGRFHFAFQSFVRACASAQHPLIIFLDDLQWADLPSLGLLQALMTDPEIGHFGVIGTYRDNEVASRPLSSMLDVLREQRVAVTTVTLEALTLAHVAELLDDMLHCGRARAAELASLLIRTEGNPFFLGQLLSSLFEEGLLDFDASAAGWRWDTEGIRAHGFTHDVVELIAGKIQRLAPEAQRAVRLAACIGSRFDLHTLSIIEQRSLAETAASLGPAIEEGLILPFGDAAQVMAAVRILGSAGEAPAASFRFLHDRVQQAAYSLINEAQRGEIHHELGRLLLVGTAPAALESRIFDVVNQFVLGIDGVHAPAERYEVARLCLLAGQRAKASAAFEPALRYLTTGLGLLPEGAFAEQHALAMKLYTEGAQVAYLNADMGKAEELAGLAMAHARTVHEKVEVLETRMLCDLSQNRYAAAICAGLEALELLGVRLPSKAAPQDFAAALERNRAALGGRKVADLVKLPENTDAAMLAAQRILAHLGAPSKTANPLLFLLVACENFYLCVRHGNSRYAPTGYVTYGAIHASALKDASAALAYGELASAVLEKRGEREARAQVNLLLAVLIKPWKAHIRETLPMLLEGLMAGVETADLQHAGHCATNLCTSTFLAGLPLDAVRNSQAKHVAFLVHMKHDTLLLFAGIAQQTVLNLLGDSPDPRRLAGRSFDEERSLPLLIATKNFSSTTMMHACKSMLAYLFGDHAAAVAEADAADATREAFAGHPMLIVQNLYGTLSLVAHCLATPEGDHAAHLEKIAQNHAELARWAADAPDNFLHKLRLVEAERARLAGRGAEAVTLFEQAIRGAVEQGFMQDEAVACERCADLCRALGWERAGEAYLIDAHYAYLRWGAKAKVAELEQRYPGLLSHRAAVERGAPSDTWSGTISTSRKSDQLELGSVMKAAQAISGEIMLDRLVQSLLRIMIENAGAQRGFLLLDRKGGLVLEAEWAAGQAAVIARGGTPLADETNLSHAVVHYAARTGESVVLANAAVEGLFTKDPYVAHSRPKSVLCAPLVYQGRSIGVIYLENNLTEGAFAADRLEVLRLLSGQAALSIHNANLYATLEQKVEERTRELRGKNEELVRTQGQLVTHEKLASLGMLTAGIAHELKNPLNFIINFADLSAQLLEELSAELAGQRPALDPSSLEVIDESIGLARENLSKIEAHGKRANQIISGMLLHSRNTPGERRFTDVNAVLAESVALACQQTYGDRARLDLEVRADYHQAVGLIIATPGDLSRVFVNIIGNACYALAQKKKKLGAAFAPRLEVTTKDLGDRVEIRVADNGPGIPQEIVDKIFVPFFTTKPPGEGTGLGLSMSHDIIVGGHRGSVEVETLTGEGATFIVTLPRDAPSSQSARPAKIQPARGPQTVT